jgi:hypothetical protein
VKKQRIQISTNTTLNDKIKKKSIFEKNLKKDRIQPSSISQNCDTSHKIKLNQPKKNHEVMLSTNQMMRGKLKKKKQKWIKKELKRKRTKTSVKKRMRGDIKSIRKNKQLNLI